MKNTIINRTAIAIAIMFTALLFTSMAHAQNIYPANGSAGIGTNVPNASSILDISSTSKGMLTPRMTRAQRNAIASPATGLLIYQTDNAPGFFYYNGSIWTALNVNSASPRLII